MSDAHAHHGDHDHAHHDHDHHDHHDRHDHHGHDHTHGGHGHVHAPADFGRAFAIGIALNIVFVVVEVGFGLAANSMALIADAGHNLSDVLALVVAWIADRAARRPPSARYTYGLAGTSIWAALFNAVFLMLAVGAIALEAVQRLLAPEPVSGLTMIVVAGIGIVINGVTARLFAGSGDLNIRGAYLHMLTDAVISAGVVVAGLAVLASGWIWIDPVVSLIVVAVVVWGTWGLLRESTGLAVAAVPAGIDPAEVRATLAALPGVAGLHDLHVWAMSTTEVALTAHLVMPGGTPGDGFLRETAEMLEDRFGIGHATLQIETTDGGWCRLEPDGVL